MINTIIRIFKKPLKENSSQTPKGACLNCWGYQEYDNIVRQLHYDRQINVNNGVEKYSFIQDFVITNLDGIRLINGIKNNF
ncbi:MAG: hypothetical protein HRT73_03150 [Flavobacteriales bacterium]|nr:hypothetical protein [Flavobacteriales bacterium]NQX96862.1 hypothetical protein [Flavobacteriales bacterium]